MASTRLWRLRYRISEELCPAGHADALELSITELLGDEHKAAPGHRYVVRAKYVLGAPGIARLCLSSHGRSKGASAELREGTGHIELTAEVLEVTPGREDVLDVIMFGPGGEELGVRMRLTMTG